ncbi:MAG: ABC transporter substrate-binding protein [Kiloniellales bacterium]|nr:ABC transporter substrate-binding protein [Kiloniellales bacterium]
MKLLSRMVLVAALVSGPATGGGAAESLAVGNFVDFSDHRSLAGKAYGQARIDAVEYINRHGGINGRQINLLTVDYGTDVEQAKAAYAKWKARHAAVAVLGWVDGDAEALVEIVAADRTPYFAASYAAALTDPLGKGTKTERPAPYSFFYGPSSSDAQRALVQWAAEDWAAEDWAAKDGAAKDARRAPRYLHMGDPLARAGGPRGAGEAHARELGFEVLAAIFYSQEPGDFRSQCRELAKSGADYAFLANGVGANVALLKACAAQGVETQFLANVWGYDETVMQAAGPAADGVVWVMGASAWGEAAAGMALVREVSKMSDPHLNKHRSVHYLRGVCSVFLMKEAMERADREGGVTGPKIKAAMYGKPDWVPRGLEGVCLPATWSAEDHRGVVDVPIYRGHAKATEVVTGALADLVAAGAISMERLTVLTVPRKADWLGW